MDLNGRMNVRQYFNVGGERYEFGTPLKQASHSCSICNAKFSTDFEVQRHILDTHSSIFNEHSCPACGENFDSENSLARHALEVHQVVLELECLNCDIFFPTQEELQKHNRAFHSDVSYNEEHTSTEASKVRVEYNYNLSPAVSSQEKHGKSGPDPDVIHCPYCRKTTNSVDELKRHMNKVHPQEHNPSTSNLQCPHCRKKGRTAEDLQEHIEEAHSAQTCTNCGKLFGDEHALLLHAENDHGNIRQPRHTCRFCQKQFSTSSSINFHLNREHTSETDRKCVDCPITYESANDRNHFRDYHLVFTCNQCDAKINGRKAYTFHNESEHSVGLNPSISCAHCPKVFSSRESYTYHLKTIHKVEMKYQCDVCGKTFNLKGNLSVHKQLHIQLECDLCKKFFKGRYHLRNHLENVHNIVHEMKIECSYCPRYFSSGHSYRIHEATVHKPKKNVKCEVCGKAMLKCSLANHMKIHRKNKFLTVFGTASCGICDQFGGIRTKHLIAHCENDHDTPRTPEIRCKLCPKFFSLKNSYSLHVHTEHPGTEEECTLCPKKFTAENGVFYQRAYQGIKCKECFNHYKCKYEFLIHLENVHPHRPLHSKYTCPQCEMKFSCYTTMRYHAIYTHHAIGDFDCDKCGLKFINKTMLKDHILACYGIAMSEYKCAQCDATFLARFLLKRHEKTHTKRKEGPAAMLKCFCGRLFRRKALLDRHVLTHTGHCMTCEVCNKRFIYEINLKKHMERHSGEQFMCGMCQKVFVNKNLLTTHMQSHIGGLIC